MNRAVSERDGNNVRSVLPVSISAGEDTAEAYLLSVRREASLISDVIFSASVRSEAPRVVREKLHTRLEPTPWAAATLQSFEALHAYTGQCEMFREAGGVLPASDVATPSLREIILGVAPALQARRRQARLPQVDIEDWPSSGDDDDAFDDASMHPSSSSSTPSSAGEEAVNHIPWLATLMTLNQPGVRCLLEEAVSAAARAAIERPTHKCINLHQAMWFYALLTRLQKPLLAIDGAVLRQLYCLCREQKESLQQNESSDGIAGEGGSALIAALDTLLVVAGAFFGQRLSHE